jgi:hypothetical protein
MQYRVLADHRLHFGRLYFQVIGTNLALVTAAATAIGIGKPQWWTAARFLAGIVLMGTAFVAHRLRRQEALYASALEAIEREEEGMDQIPAAPRHGARQLVVAALIGTGLALALEAGRHLIAL